MVTRQDLAGEVWGSERFVNFERGLNFAIRQIRSALEDDAAQPRFLETLPKRGYRFTALVSGISAPTELESPAPTPIPWPAPRRLIPHYGLACLAAAAIAITLTFVLDWGHFRQPLSGAASAPRIESVGCAATPQSLP